MSIDHTPMSSQFDAGYLKIRCGFASGSCPSEGHDVRISEVGSNLSITIDGDDPRYFSTSQVSRIVFSGGDGNDTFVNGSSIPAHASGGRGRLRGTAL